MACAADLQGRGVDSFFIDPAFGDWTIVAGDATLKQGFGSPLIKRGSEVNHLRAICDGRTDTRKLLFYANGSLLGEASIREPRLPYTVMGVSADSAGTVEVRFDNAVFSSSAPPSGAALAQQGILATISVRPGDLPVGYPAQLIPGGDQVTGQVTLDLCGGTFISEGLRVARRQIEVLGPDGGPVIGTEAVLYQSPDATAQAFRELRHTQSACPHTFVPGSTGGTPPLKTVFRSAPDHAWPAVPGVHRLAFDLRERDQAGHSVHQVLVYLVRGNVFLGLYFNRLGPQPVIEGETTIAGITKVFETRMAQLPPITAP